ncbi:hypothetical protein LLG46_13990 [bacterium]|nr:hypothetical protein [bacterium]
MRNALFISALALLICGSAWATGKITVDPNASDQAAIQEWESDTRLAQKVTYEARHKAVKVILADLSDMTGVTFNAGYNKQDWQVRDRKMNIFAKDIALTDLMSSIARTMKFKWSINKTDVPWTYRLYMDRKALVSANAELSKSQEEYDREVNRRRENFLNMFENWDDDLTSGELANLRDDNPYAYMLNTQGIGALMQGVIRDIPGFKDKFLSRTNDMLSKVSSFSPETQEALLNAAKLSFSVKDDGVAGSGGAFPEDCEKAFSKGEVYFDISPDELGWKSYEFSKLAGLGLYINGRFFCLNSYLGDPSDPWVQAFAKNNLQAVENGVSIQHAWDHSEDRVQARIAETQMLEKYFPTEPQPDVADEPDLHIKIKVKPEPEPNRRVDLVDLEAAVAKASGFAVVSDSYKITYGYAAVSDSETELKDVLTTIGDGYRYNWDKHGDIIEFRSKEWFKKRTTQIPDEWIETWRADLKKLGYMPLEDGAQIAALTTPQIEENIHTDSDLSQSGLFRDGSRDIWLLRLYASLTTTQRKDVFSDMGLNTFALTQDQWQLMRRIYDINFDPNVLLTFLRSSRMAPNKYVFSIYGAANNNLLGKWSLWLLEYKEPPKPEPETPEAQDKGEKATAPASDSQTKTTK